MTTGSRPARYTARSSPSISRGRPRAPTPLKGELRRVMYDLLEHSLEAVAITGNRLEPLADRGDGVLTLIRPHDDVPKTVLLGRLMPLLADMLAEYNAQAASVGAADATARGGARRRGPRGQQGLLRRGHRRRHPAARRPAGQEGTEAGRGATRPRGLGRDPLRVVCQGYVDADAYFRCPRARRRTRRHRGWVHVPAHPCSRRRRPVAVHLGTELTANGRVRVADALGHGKSAGTGSRPSPAAPAAPRHGPAAG